MELTVNPEDRLFPAASREERPSAIAMPEGVPAVYDANRGLIRLLAKNFLLTILTIGIYRFWARTALRRYFWSAVSVDDDRLEYTGRGSELFLGFLIVFAVFVPVSVGYAALQTMLLDNVSARIWLTVLYVAALMLLIAAASYRARRYRLSRTVWRGIRAGQDGSTWIYVGRYAVWSIAALLTLGLSVPWACADLARYRLTHSFWGDSRGRFEGRATELLLPWLLVIAPPVLLGLSAVQLLTNVIAAIIAAPELPWVTTLTRIWALYPVGGAVIALFVVTLLATPLFYVYFRLRWLRWYVAGSRLGPIAFGAHFKPARLLIRGMLGYLLLFFALVVLVGAFTWIWVTLMPALGPDKPSLEGFAAFSAYALMLPFYLILYAVASILAMVLVTVPVLRRVVAGVTVTGLALAAAVRQSEAEVDSKGEGLADSFDVGFG